MAKSRSERNGSHANAKFGVSGGFRAGKRRKGNSLLKLESRTNRVAGDIRKGSILETLEIDRSLVVGMNGNGAVKEMLYSDPENKRRQV